LKHPVMDTCQTDPPNLSHIQYAHTHTHTHLAGLDTLLNIEKSLDFLLRIKHLTDPAPSLFSLLASYGETG
jgi:hypothetical protein